MAKETRGGRVMGEDIPLDVSWTGKKADYVSPKGSYGTAPHSELMMHVGDAGKRVVRYALWAGKEDPASVGWAHVETEDGSVTDGLPSEVLSQAIRRELGDYPWKMPEAVSEGAGSGASGYITLYSDANIEYGGVFWEPDDMRVVEVIDMDSASGLTGVNLVEVGSVFMDEKHIRSSAGYIGAEDKADQMAEAFARWEASKKPYAALPAEDQELLALAASAVHGSWGMDGGADESWVVVEKSEDEPDAEVKSFLKGFPQDRVMFADDPSSEIWKILGGLGIRKGSDESNREGENMARAIEKGVVERALAEAVAASMSSGVARWLAEAKMSQAARDFISEKIGILRREGKPEDQAVAIAHSMAREAGYDVPDPKESEEPEGEPKKKPDEAPKAAPAPAPALESIGKAVADLRRIVEGDKGGEVMDPKKAPIQYPDGDSLVGDKPKKEDGGDPEHYGKEKDAPEADLDEGSGVDPVVRALAKLRKVVEDDAPAPAPAKPAEEPADSEPSPKVPSADEARRARIRQMLRKRMGHGAGGAEPVSEALSKKHFQAIADIVKGVRDKEVRWQVGAGLADYFRRENPNFDTDRFLKAIGFGPEARDEAPPSEQNEQERKRMGRGWGGPGRGGKACPFRKGGDGDEKGEEQDEQERKRMGRGWGGPGRGMGPGRGGKACPFRKGGDGDEKGEQKVEFPG